MKHKNHIERKIILLFLFLHIFGCQKTDEILTKGKKRDRVSYIKNNLMTNMSHIGKWRIIQYYTVKNDTIFPIKENSDSLYIKFENDGSFSNNKHNLYPTGKYYIKDGKKITLTYHKSSNVNGDYPDKLSFGFSMTVVNGYLVLQDFSKFHNGIILDKAEDK